MGWRRPRMGWNEACAKTKLTTHLIAWRRSRIGAAPILRCYREIGRKSSEIGARHWRFFIVPQAKYRPALLQHNLVTLTQAAKQFRFGTIGNANGNCNFALAVLTLGIRHFDLRLLVFVVDDRVLRNDQHVVVFLEDDLG